MEESLVGIDKQKLESLIKAQRKLAALEACGVDNWEGYSDAMELLDDPDFQ